MKYVLWDWNGTLLDDTRAAIDTLNDMLARRGSPAIGMEFYRDNFAFPVRPFYESIGVALENEDWDALAREYHDIYGGKPKALNVGALAALDRVRSAGVGQSIISALRQDLLERDTAAFGVAGYMDFLYGVDNLDGLSKTDRARELVSRIRAANAGSDVEFVLIGDSLHDKDVADAVGAGCVLCGEGSHAAWRLRRVAPTGDTLADAVAMALA